MLINHLWLFMKLLIVLKIFEKCIRQIFANMLNTVTCGLNYASQFSFSATFEISHQFCKYWLRQSSWNSLFEEIHELTLVILTLQVSWQIQLWSPDVNPKLPVSYQITIFYLIEIHLFTRLKECLWQIGM